MGLSCTESPFVGLAGEGGSKQVGIISPCFWCVKGAGATWTGSH